MRRRNPVLQTRAMLEGLEGRTLLSVAAYLGPQYGHSGLTSSPVSDDFSDFTGATPTVKYTTVSGNAPTKITGTLGTYLSLNNGLIRADLNQSLTEDFTVTGQMLPTAYGTGQYVALMNAAGTQGYAFYWDTATSGSWGGQGFVQVRKFNLASELNDWTNTGTALTGSTQSGHTVNNGALATYALTWDNATHQLTLAIDGVQKATVTDSSFNTFARVYLRGNGSTAFDNLTVSTGNKLQAGTLIDDRFTGPAAQTDPSAKADQTWIPLAGTAVLGGDGAERKLHFTASGTRYATSNASVLDTVANAKIVNVTYDIRRAGTAADGGAIALVNAAGAGYVFYTDLPTDASNKVSLRVYTTTDAGATKSQIGTVDFTGLSGTGNHTVNFSWDRSTGKMIGTVDGKTPQTVINGNVTYNTFTRAVALSAGATLWMDNVLVTAVPTNAVVYDSAYGANGNGTTDNQSDLTSALAAAAASASKTLYLPAGVYAHSGTLTLNGVTLIGTGQATVLAATNANTSAIYLKGTAPALRRVRLTCVASTRGTQLDHHAVVIDHATGYAVTDVQEEASHAAGIFSYGASFGNEDNNTVLNTMADGMHHTNAAHDIQAFNNDIRNVGDDQIAVVTYAGETPEDRISVFRNTTNGQTNGRGLSVVGGTNVNLENNEVRNSWGSAIYIASEYNTPLHDISVRRNLVDSPRGLNENGVAGTAPAVHVYGSATAGAAATNIVFDGNSILHSADEGIDIGAHSASVTLNNNTISDVQAGAGILVNGKDVAVSNNTVTAVSTYGIFVNANSQGTVNLNHNHLSNLNRSNTSYVDAILIDYGAQNNSLFSALLISANDDTEPVGVTLDKFIEDWLPAAKTTASGNTTNSGKASYFQP